MTALEPTNPRPKHIVNPMDNNERDLERFDFGSNWQRFIDGLTEDQIHQARLDLLDLLDVTSLDGKHFLDIGSGSGLSSLAAYRAGAKVTSFDFDPLCVACTAELKRRENAGDEHWTVVKGSILDTKFLDQLGEFDVVYSWGVLHHTGAMWDAISNAAEVVTANGMLVIAIYNDQQWLSRYWTRVKRIYNRSPLGKVAMLALHSPYFLAARFGGNVLHALKHTSRTNRGMRFWPDVIDWVGGYPFEVASPNAVAEFLQHRGLEMTKLVSVGRRSGCNEFVFRRATT